MSDKTAAFYAVNAADYVAAGSHRDNLWRDRFLAALRPGAAILELGCGGGYDTQAMMAHGFQVTPTDGVPEMAAEAQKRLGVPVRVLGFRDIAFEAAFDGVFASACLLHAQRGDLAGILTRIRRALRPVGTFYASFKAGDGEGMDGLGRYYNYPDPDWLRQTYAMAGWPVVTMEEADGSGYDRKPTRWLHVFAGI